MNTVNSPSAEAKPEKLLFLHIPKTGGLSVTRILENYFCAADCQLHLSGPDARQIRSPEQLSGKFVTGHFAHNIWRLAGKEFAKLTVLRHPIERYVSQVNHWMRSSRDIHNHKLPQNSIVEAELELTSPSRYWFIHSREQHCQFQNCYLKAASDDIDWEKTPISKWPAAELNLDSFDIVGIVGDFQRFLHLVCDLFKWPAAPFYFQLNQFNEAKESKELSVMVRSHLDLFEEDMKLYRSAIDRFNDRYRSFLRAKFPGIRDLDSITNSMVDDALNEQFLEYSRNYLGDATDRVEWSMDLPCYGRGWWWRQYSGKVWYRCTGPQRVSTIYLPPLLPEFDYRFLIDVVFLASDAISKGLKIFIDGHPCTYRQMQASDDPDDVKIVLEGFVPRVCTRSGRPIVLSFHLPETKPVLAQTRIEQSEATDAWDTRLVGLGIGTIRIERMIGSPSNA